MRYSEIFLAISESIAPILLSKLLTASLTSGKLRSSTELGLVAGFLSKSYAIKDLNRGGTVEGISIALVLVMSLSFVAGCLLLVNSYKIMPNAYMSTFVVGSYSLKTSGALYNVVV